MLRRLYDWTLSLAASRHAMTALFLVAFVEASVFPIPPDALMIPMVLALPRRAWIVAGMATMGSVSGGALGYLIGAQFYELIGAPVLAALGKTDAMAAFGARFNDNGFWAVLIAGLTPFPYKVITIMSGWTGMPFATFMATSVLARGLRFFIVAALLWKLGAPMRDFIERRLGLVFTLFVLLLLGGFVLIRYL